MLMLITKIAVSLMIFLLGSVLTTVCYQLLLRSKAAANKFFWLVLEILVFSSMLGGILALWLKY